MELDRTHLKIRVRKISEIGDLALVMIRRYPGAIGVGFLLGALPWILANTALLAWIPIREAGLGLNDSEAIPELMRYFIWMTLLVFLQAPAAGVAATYYLGQAVFEERPTWTSVFREIRSRFTTWFTVLGIVRMPVIAMGILAVRIGQPFNGFVDAFVPLGFAVAAWLLRGSRPFLPEILLLEQCPLRVPRSERGTGSEHGTGSERGMGADGGTRAEHGTTLTAGRRSSRLHNPLSGELNARFMVIAIGSVLLAASLYFTFSSATILLTGNRWNQGLFPILFLFPVSLWLVAAISVVFRLLNYLDSRIRLEGWDVELSVRAEAIRQFGDFSEVTGSAASRAPDGSDRRTASPPGRNAANTLASLVAALLVTVAAGGAMAQSPDSRGDTSPDRRGDTSASLPAVRDSSEVVDDSVWFDAQTGSVKPVEVTDRSDDTIHRDSRWLPQAKKVRKAAKPVAAPKAGGTPGAGTGGGFLSGLFSGDLTLGNVLAMLAMLGVVILLCVLLYVLLGKVDPERSTATGRSRIDPVVDEQMIERISQLPQELRRTDVNMRTEAERLMKQGQYELAIILLFGHQLLLCDRAAMLRLSRGKTNGRYVRETRDADGPAGQILGRTAVAFDRSFFGEHPPSSEQFARLWQDNTVLEERAHTVMESAA